MPAPTNPKKKSLMPSTPLRRKLRGAGHALAAVVQIGKDGATAAVCKQLRDALGTHELVKVKIGSECPQSRFEVAELLGAEPDVQVAQILGRTVLVYKRDPKRSRYEGTASADEPGAGEPGAGKAGAGTAGAGKARKPDKKSGKRLGRRSGKRSGKTSGKRSGKRSGRKSRPA